MRRLPCRRRNCRRKSISKRNWRWSSAIPAPTIASARDCQFADGQWARGKSFDTFCPLGPWLETELDPSDLKIEGRLNGEVMQKSRTSLLIFSIPFLISYLSRGMTLTPGTVILSGTPAGCGFARKPPVWIKPGDIYEVDIEGIGVLRNRFIG